MAEKQRGGMQFDFSMSDNDGSRLPPEAPFRILVIGDFSGQNPGAVREPLASRRPMPVDVDEIDKCIARLHVGLHLPPEPPDNTPVDLSFAELADFHPDAMYARTPLFSHLGELRRNLQNPATFEKAATEVRSWADARPPARPPESPHPPAPPSARTGDNPFAQLLGKTISPHKASKTIDSADPKIAQFIEEIVRPHVVAAGDPDQGNLLSLVNQAICRRMNAILHHPDFQALEAAWRGLDFLIHNIETDENLTISMLDVSPEELAADLQSAQDLAQTRLHRVLVNETRRTPGGIPWALLVGLYAFQENDTHAILLQRLGELAAQAGAPFLAGTEYQPDRERDGKSFWRKALSDAAANHVALVVPRLILRLPYGPDTDAIDSFHYEEMPGNPVHADYLWGNGALACACLMAQAFSESGRPVELGSIDRLGGLPLHVWAQDGEKNMTPPAEYWLADSDAEDLIARGMIPLMSVKGADAISVARFQTVSGRPLPLNA